MGIELKNIAFQYPLTKAPVFHNLSFRLPESGFHALFCPSGVGKSTLAQIISTPTHAHKGEVHANHMGNILYSYNLERLPGWTSVGEHFQAVTPESHQNHINELVDAFGLERCLDSRFSQLSLGQQNRTNLTRYLLQDFDLLIMDESLANVDETTRKQIILKIKSTYAGKCFLYISHSLSEVATFCRQILVLRTIDKTPQIISIEGLDLNPGETADHNALEQIMLEMVHAS